MVLSKAFNMITMFHSRSATLKRLGTPDIFSLIRITPANYFRFLVGPSQTVIRGREFIIPVESMKGHATEVITFSDVPTVGGFHLTYDGNDTDPIDFDATASDVQSALRDITGLENITVSGDFTDGFVVVFVGVEDPELLIAVQETIALDSTITIQFSPGTPWSPIIKRGDKIIDSILGHMAIDEIIEMPDIGGSIMGYRVRAE